MTQKSPLATTLDDMKPAPRPARVFSGIQPTGGFHIGNYLGAVRTWRQQVEAGYDETMFCIVDAHAITTPYDPKALRKNIDELALDLQTSRLDGILVVSIHHDVIVRGRRQIALASRSV